MAKIMQMLLRFTEGSYSFTYKVLSVILGTIVFLGITPLLVFFVHAPHEGYSPIFSVALLLCKSHTSCL